MQQKVYKRYMRQSFDATINFGNKANFSMDLKPIKSFLQQNKSLTHNVILGIEFCYLEIFDVTGVSRAAGTWPATNYNAIGAVGRAIPVMLNKFEIGFTNQNNQSVYYQYTNPDKPLMQDNKIWSMKRPQLLELISSWTVSNRGNQIYEYQPLWFNRNTSADYVQGRAHIIEPAIYTHYRDMDEDEFGDKESQIRLQENEILLDLSKSDQQTLYCDYSFDILENNNTDDGRELFQYQYDDKQTEIIRENIEANLVAQNFSRIIVSVPKVRFYIQSI